MVRIRSLLRQHQYEHVGDENGAGVDDDQGEGHELGFKQQQQAGGRQNHHHEIQRRIDGSSVCDHPHRSRYRDGTEEQEENFASRINLTESNLIRQHDEPRECSEPDQDAQSLQPKARRAQEQVQGKCPGHACDIGFDMVHQST